MVFVTLGLGRGCKALDSAMSARFASVLLHELCHSQAPFFSLKRKKWGYIEGAHL